MRGGKSSYLFAASRVSPIGKISGEVLKGITWPRWQAIGAAIFLWSVYGVGSALLEHYMSSASTRPVSWSRAFGHECLWAFQLAVASPFVMWLARSFRLDGLHARRNWTIHVFATVLYGAVAHVFWYGWMQSFGLAETESLAGYLRQMSWGVAEGAPFYWLIVLVQNSAYYQQRYQASLAAASELNAQLARAQLHSLKMQLHPHFLFNTLHAISELIHENASAAERMVLGLSQLLRMSLDTSTTIEVPLRQELRFTEIYLGIEKMRFDERLEIEVDIDDELQDAMVPNLILQPLLENSIKHGISKRTGQGQIRISAKKANGVLVIAIRDNGAGCDVQRTPLREGIGLSTTRARLEKLYGSKQNFSFLRREGNGAEAVMSLPLRIERTEGRLESIASSDRR